MGDSKFFGSQGPAKPHLVRGPGGLSGEVYDLRKDVDIGFETMEAETAIIHKPTITPAEAEPAPGLGPVPVVLGNSVIGLHFDNTTDRAYRLMKIDTTFVVGGDGPAGDGSNASFHIHWTKAVDTDQSGATVRWRLTYTIFDGNSDEITAGGTQGFIEWDDTYDDAGTTTRIVYRTGNEPVAGFVPGYYVGMCLEYIPASTTLVGGPVVISTDLLFRNLINVTA